jgi:Saxitoxin biosynthesis operon protein SxtJ
MQWSDIPWRPATRTVRQFGLLWLAFFGLAAAWQAVAGKYIAALFLAALAATFGPLGLLKPRWVRPLYVGWMVLVFPLGWLVSRIVLAAVFYGLFTPMGLLLRLCGRDVLLLRPRPEQPTYWLPKALPADPRQYLRQF